MPTEFSPSRNVSLLRREFIAKLMAKGCTYAQAEKRSWNKNF